MDHLKSLDVLAVLTAAGAIVWTNINSVSLALAALYTATRLFFFLKDRWHGKRD